MYEAHFLGRQDLGMCTDCVCVRVRAHDEKACVIINGMILAFVAKPFVRTLFSLFCHLCFLFHHHHFLFSPQQRRSVPSVRRLVPTLLTFSTY